MRLKTLMNKARSIEGVTVKTVQTKEGGDGNIISDVYRTVIVDYRNQDGSVGVRPKRGVSIQHTKAEAQFVEAIRIDVLPHLVLAIRTVKATAKIFNFN